MTTIPANPAGHPLVLEKDVPLSQSVIWKMQRDFYVQRGLKAWSEDRVPEFITNNPFIAEIYARIVCSYLRDCLRLQGASGEVISAGNPLRIVEIGAGSGKFCYLFLRNLSALFEERALSLEMVRYRMSDCSEDLVKTWRSNVLLDRFAQRGILEFELLDEADPSKRWPAQSPLVVIANYVFDSLPQDVFVLKDGEISEALVSTAAPPGSEADPSLRAVSLLKLSYRNVPVPLSRYADPSWMHILEHYRMELKSATITFPSQALTMLQQLGNLSNGRMLVLAADKGLVDERTLPLFQGPPTLEFHGANCFSQMVNLDAIARYFQSSGGEALLPEKHFSNFNICGFLQGKSGDQFLETADTYRKRMAEFGPDDLFSLLSWLHPHMPEMKVPQILSLLRLTRWDPVALMRLFPVLGPQLGSVAGERQDLREAVFRIWNNHFPVTPGENVLAFQCGVILLELRFYAEARSMFEISQNVLGPSAPTSFNLALCAQGLENRADAWSFLEQACALDPRFEPARAMREKLSGLAGGR